MLRTWLVLGAFLLTGCAPTSEDEGGGGNEFTYSSSFAEPEFTVTVVDENGAPLAGVSVSVEDVYLEDRDDDSARSHAVYLLGLTDSTGVFRGTARLPEMVQFVDIVVHDDSGRTGPWTDTALLADLAEFAPSSRQTASVAQAMSFNVTLESE